MQLTENQIKIISSSIMICDIQAYINSHLSEYEEFLKNEKAKISTT